MRNASRLLYIVCGIFAAGFVFETFRTVLDYNETYSAPLRLYVLTYIVFYLIPAATAFIVARLLAKHAGNEGGVEKVNFKRLRKKNY